MLPVLGCLSWLFFWFFLSWAACPGLFFQFFSVLGCLSRAVCPGLFFQFFLSWAACPGLFFQFFLSWAACPGLFVLAVFLVFLSWAASPGLLLWAARPVVPVLCCPVLFRNPWAAHPGQAFLDFLN